MSEPRGKSEWVNKEWVSGWVREWVANTFLKVYNVDVLFVTHSHTQTPHDHIMRHMRTFLLSLTHSLTLVAEWPNVFDAHLIPLSVHSSLSLPPPTVHCVHQPWPHKWTIFQIYFAWPHIIIPLEWNFFQCFFGFESSSNKMWSCFCCSLTQLLLTQSHSLQYALLL